MDIIFKLANSLLLISTIFGLAAFYTPWAWKSKYPFAIMYGPLGVSMIIWMLVFALSAIWS